MESERLTYLLKRYTQQALTAGERMELKDLLDSVNAAELPDELIEALSKEMDPYYSLNQSDEEIDNMLRPVFSMDKGVTVRRIHRVHFMRKWGWAAAIILLLGSAVFLYTINKKSEQPIVETTLPSDILPGTNKAVLTLADGRTIALDSTVSGNIAEQGNSAIVKTAIGEIVYNAQGAAENEVMMNTMATPRGGQYQLQLSDGTKIWLNAASSVTYPAVFVGRERKIKITGEAYLEVAKDKTKPFIVDIDGKSSVEVLGTSFNISSYPEEPIKTTLVEGSIKMNNKMLQPGEQAIVSESKLEINREVDISQVLAWKNGYFSFQDASLQQIAGQLERWYDIEVEFETGAPNITLRGKMDRGVRLSGVMQLLDDFGVKTKLENRTLIITK